MLVGQVKDLVFGKYFFSQSAEIISKGTISIKRRMGKVTLLATVSIRVTSCLKPSNLSDLIVLSVFLTVLILSCIDQTLRK